MDNKRPPSPTLDESRPLKKPKQAHDDASGSSPKRDEDASSEGKEASPGKEGKEASPGKEGKEASPGKEGKETSPGKEGKEASHGKEGKEAPPSHETKQFDEDEAPQHLEFYDSPKSSEESYDFAERHVVGRNSSSSDSDDGGDYNSARYNAGERDEY